MVLEKPLAFFDLESTSADPNTARIIEFGGVKIYPDGSQETLHLRINPGVPIPAESTEIHGITDEDVAECGSFDEQYPLIIEFLEDADVAGYNSNRYDVPLLAKQLEEQGCQFPLSPDTKFIDVMNIFKRKENHKLTKAVEFYCGVELENAHSAVADIMATADVFKAQLEKYEDLGNMTMSELALYSNYDKLPSIDREGKFGYNEAGEVVFTFGRNLNLPVSKDMKYLDWMEFSSTMSDHVKSVCASIRKEILREKINARAIA